MLATRPMVFGGGISYSIYLLQAPVKDMVLSISDRLHIQSGAVRMAIMAVFLMALSAISFKMIEGPARLRLRSVFARLEQRRKLVERTKIAA
jgi:peptidoglycan/LPS O-acetylase OafA/YrhL